ncbi:hypothetical protein ACC687_42495, partial [Rhizobium ruizarguesonis]
VEKSPKHLTPYSKAELSGKAGSARTAGADLLFASPQIFPEIFGGALAAQFRLRFDSLFAALLAGFGLFIHATGLAE